MTRYYSQFRDSLKNSISNKNLILLESKSDYEEKIKIFKYLLNKKEFNSMKNSILANLVESIEKGNTQEIIRMIENYTGQNKSNQQSEPDMFGIRKAESIANNIYETFYGNDFIISILLINYLILDLVVLLLFLFKNAYLLDFILAFIYLFVLIVVFTFTASLSWINDLSVVRKIIIFVFLPAVLSFFQTLNFKKPKKYSRLKTLNIIIFPFALIIVAYFILYILYDKKIFVSEDNNNISNFIQTTIIIISLSLVYLPFIPCIKAQLTRQLSLPKN